MKKIFFLMFIMGAFSPLINAYEYIIYYNNTDNTSANRPKEVLYINNDGKIHNYYYWYDSNNNLQVRDSVLTDNTAFSQLGYIKRRNVVTDFGYIRNSDFVKYYQNDLIFLNQLYSQITQPFLNFLYNNAMTHNNHIIYNDYELLYNSNGLAVESILNGVWAGLYSDDEKGVSGSLYSSNGTLLYYNGEPVNWIQATFDPFLNKIKQHLIEMWLIIANPISVAIAVIFVFIILYFVVCIGQRAIKVHPNNRDVKND